jgi:hypothetical protein
MKCPYKYGIIYATTSRPGQIMERYTGIPTAVRICAECIYAECIYAECIHANNGTLHWHSNRCTYVHTYILIYTECTHP